MPSVKEGESRKDYLKRCIPYVLNEGKTDDPGQAAAICHGLYDKYEETKKTVRSKRDPSGYWKSIGVKVGDLPGHPFRGNQYTDGEGGSTDSDPTESRRDVQPVYDAINTILSDRASYNTSLNYAVNYAREALNMSGRELQVQVLYILNNLGSWRHPEAARVRQTLREFAKPPKRPKQRID